MADRKWQPVRDAMLEFGCHRNAIRVCVSDKAPEFARACQELNVANFDGTPGRPTAHATIERANRTVLEWTRPSLEQSGLSLAWAGLAARHALFTRRLTTCNSDGVSIYARRFPDLPEPPLWPFGAELVFKPTPLQHDAAKCAPRARAGLLVGFHLNPGGPWSGDLLCAELRCFEASAGRAHVRIFRTKTATWRPDSRPRFPTFEAKARAKRRRLEDGVNEEIFREVPFEMVGEADDSGDEDAGEEPETKETGGDETLEEGSAEASAAKLEPEALMHYSECRALHAGLPKGVADMFRQGGWFNRLPRIPLGTGKPPNRGSRRPGDIDVVAWSGSGPLAQARELRCREDEATGGGPPALEPGTTARMTDAQRAAVEEARRRADASGASSSTGLSAPATEKPAQELCFDPALGALVFGEERRPRGAAAQPAAAALAAAWPEGDAARGSLEAWCLEEGVPPPQPPRVGHRDKADEEMTLGFGLVTRPISAGSPEWKSAEGQRAIEEEMANHAKRGTWDVSGVIELDGLMKECRNTGEDAIIGGIHPILGAKQAEKGVVDYRCRVVFSAPRARSASGLDVHCLYDEISSSPITFQGSRTLRAYAALKGFVISSRDATSAYLQSKLQRDGKNDPRTFVALPRQYWPPEWDKLGLRRPMVPFIISLYGHPVAGNRWEMFPAN